MAAAQYIKDNYAAVLASATASTPATITVPMLKSQYPQMFATGFFDEQSVRADGDSAGVSADGRYA
ncbi:hypothetical protein [Burkholderia multivorans]|uniref:hypothetical protein n=1 Tax=Burkholderia multivorans TaxID=87883 RepID=UPI0028707A01|nr:hypothetical protein [Burkholderia multivorans]